MKAIDLKLPESAKKLTPLEMNGIAILKAHTVITFSEDNHLSDPHPKSQK